MTSQSPPRPNIECLVVTKKNTSPSVIGGCTDQTPPVVNVQRGSHPAQDAENQGQHCSSNYYYIDSQLPQICIYLMSLSYVPHD